MKGIILAAGSGTRLYPVTLAISKILLPVYDKPMIYYPISILMQAGIKDILIITSEHDLPNFKKLLGDGSQFGVNFSYEVQHKPLGISHAFILGEKFIGNDCVTLILGDNIFFGNNFSQILKEAAQRTEKGIATVFGYRVDDPERFGVVEFDKDGKALSIEEKPKNPKSDYAVTGLYFYDNKAIEYAKQLKPSDRGELEITDLNKCYLEKGNLHTTLLNKDFMWIDTGTIESLQKASEYVRKTEAKTGVKIACLEETAYNAGFLTKDNILKAVQNYNNEYYNYVKNIK